MADASTGTRLHERLRTLLHPDLADRLAEALQAAEAVDDLLQPAVCEHMLAFFSRHYANGRFIPRQAPGSNQVPLRPGDVGLHWPTRGMHYVQATDSFVFPGLGTFLDHALDVYLKDVVIDLEGSPETLTDQLGTVRIIRNAARRVIEMLDDAEDAKVRRFERRQRVLRSDWLVPIRHVPHRLWGQIRTCESQRAAWTALLGTPATIDSDFLETHPTLIVDTQHFPMDFVRALLEGLHETVGDIADATDGLLIHSDNYAALRTLQPLLAGKVRVVFADPPYNTGRNDFVYDDRYPRGTWLTMMEDRFRAAHALLPDDGSVWVTIDDNEMMHLHALLDDVFGTENFVANIAWQKVFAKKNKALISGSHDHILLYARQRDGWVRHLLPRDADQLRAYKNPDDDPRGRWQSVTFSVTSEDAIRRADYRYEITLPSGRRVGPPTGRHWNGLPDRFHDLRADDRIWFGRAGDGLPRVKVFLSEVQAGVVPDTWWSHDKAGNNQEAKKEVVALFGAAEPFPTPKPTRLIERILQIATDDDGRFALDFFAGSGTTGDAVIRHTRTHGRHVRFALCEMAETFDTALHPRIIKRMYAPEWKDGRPLEQPTIPEGASTPDDTLPDWIERSPRLVKVLRLSSYADGPHDLDEIARPFSSTLQTRTDAGPKAVPVDLIETANVVLGIDVARYETWTGPGDRPYLAVHGRRDGHRCLMLWRDLPGIDPIAERDFLAPRIADHDEVLINGATSTPGVNVVDPLLAAALDE